MKGKSETVKVAVRVRPMNKREQEENSQVCVDVDPTNNQISVNSPKHETKTFQFDYVYPMSSTQREVYDQVAFPIVESIFQGYNGTIFAYGQTGCGKTFTMMGVVNDPNLRGVIPNAFEHIFGYINSEGSSKKFLVRCSFVEIYNEEVRDLLGNNSNKALEVREDPKKGTFVKGLSYYPLKNTDEIVKCLDKGNANRHVGATSMNDKSSRSHSLFTVYVEIEEGEDERNKKIRSGKLNLVDLAGSERVGKTNATGQTFDEGKKINLSLTALGSVIDALSSNRKHIPYKDSKLTRLLADSLGGNTKTVMFANVSPASFNYDETVGTLRYASRAKLIKNAPKINEDPKDALLRQYEEQIKMLKEQLEGKISPQPQIIEKIIKVKDNGEAENEEPNQRNEIQMNGGQVDDTEKAELLKRIAELEKEMIGGGEAKPVVDEGKSKINEENFSLQKENQNLKSDNDEKEIQLTHKDTVIASLQKEIDASIEEYKAKLNEAQLTSDENFYQSKETQSQLEQLILERDELIRKNEELKKEYEQFNNSINEASAAFSEKCEKFEKAVNEYKAKNKEYKTKIKNLKSKINELYKEIDSLKKENQDAYDIIESNHLKIKTDNEMIYPNNIPSSIVNPNIDFRRGSGLQSYNNSYVNTANDIHSIYKKENVYSSLSSSPSPSYTGSYLVMKDPLEDSQKKSIDEFRKVLTKVDLNLQQIMNKKY